MSVKGMNELMARLEAIGEPKPVLRVMQLETVAEAKQRVHRRTGHLGRSIVPGRIAATSAFVEARTPYAAAEELGSKPHKIVAKNARALAWGGARRLSGSLKSGSAPTHFAKSVNHPGTKPHPYLLPGAKEAVKKVREAIVDLWNRAA